MFSGRVRRSVACAVLSLSGLVGVELPADAAPPEYEPTKESLAKHPLPDWYRDAKFGIFIHWGPYAVPAYGAPVLPLPVDFEFGVAEWYWLIQQIPGTSAWLHHLSRYGPSVTYDDFIPKFTARNFDPDAWIRLFEQAGAKYFNLTAKHHDGFALWPSSTTRRDAGDLGPRRDLVGELFAAAHRRDDRVKPGLYYSVPEFFNPAPQPLPPLDPAKFLADPLAYLTNTVAFESLQARNAYTQLPVPYTGYQPIGDYAAGQVRPQLQELIDRYHPNTLWCDIGGPEDYFRGNHTIADFYNRAATHNPDGVVVNDRCGDDGTHRDYEVTEQTATYSAPAPPDAVYTEVASTMGNSWGYDTNDVNLASPDALVDLLVNTVAGNGNLLLNVGPRADGTIPEPMAERLRAIGAWLRINGEAIYGSRPWTQTGDGDLRFTVGSTGDLYLTSLVWPGAELTTTAPVPVEPGTSITLLGGDGTALPYRQEDGRLIVTMPADGDQQSATRSQHAFVLRIHTPD